MRVLIVKLRPGEAAGLTVGALLFLLLVLFEWILGLGLFFLNFDYSDAFYAVLLLILDRLVNGEVLRLDHTLNHVPEQIELALRESPDERRSHRLAFSDISLVVEETAQFDQSSTLKFELLAAGHVGPAVRIL